MKPVPAYFWIDRSTLTFGVRTDRSADHFSYPLPPELEPLATASFASPEEWELLCTELADWIKVHRETLLAGADGPSDCGRRLDELVAHLRQSPADAILHRLVTPPLWDDPPPVGGRDDLLQE